MDIHLKLQSEHFYQFIFQAKVMKNMYQLDNDGKPTSKGYGFVSFMQHNDALVALRKINNNPSIFHPNKVSSMTCCFFFRH